MLNYTSITISLIQDIEELLKKQKIRYSFSKIIEKSKYKYTIRITTDTKKFIQLTQFYKK